VPDKIPKINWNSKDSMNEGRVTKNHGSDDLDKNISHPA
jgi:hypothetical protein